MGALEGRLRLGFLNEVGFNLALPPTYTWCQQGRSHRLRVPARWGSQGRLNAIGTLWLEAHEPLAYRLVEGNNDSDKIVLFLNEIAATYCKDRLTVVALDNAGFHKSKLVQEHQPE